MKMPLDRKSARLSLSAFTLVELLVVLAILSILMFVITPRFVSIVNPERAKNFVLRLHGSLQYLGDKAILEQQLYLFHFDIEEGRYYFTEYDQENADGILSSNGLESELQDRYLKPALLPEQLEVEEITLIPGEAVSSGKITIPFTPSGVMLSFQITFTIRDERRFLLVGNSLNNRISLYTSNGDEDWLALE
jgi:prepilin-type N-terminal cleavage/methylation domain-containing protein